MRPYNWEPIPRKTKNDKSLELSRLIYNKYQTQILDCGFKDFDQFHRILVSPPRKNAVKLRKELYRLLHEKILTLTPEIAYKYIMIMLDGAEYKPLEPVIARSSKYATQYAMHVLRGRFKNAEKTIATDKYWSAVYQSQVRKNT